MHAASPDSGHQISIIGILLKQALRLRKGTTNMPHLYMFLGLMFLAMLASCIFPRRSGQFLKKFWHIFLPRRTLIAIASFEKVSGHPKQVFGA